MGTRGVLQKVSIIRVGILASLVDLNCFKNPHFIQYFSSKWDALKFYTKYKQIHLLKNSLKMKKMIKIILQKFGSTIGSNIVCQWILVWLYCII